MDAKIEIKNNVMINWDKENDILYCRRGYADLSFVKDIESDRYPGIIKRVDTRSNEVVGLIFDQFKTMLPGSAHCGEDELKVLLNMTLIMTNERHGRQCSCEINVRNPYMHLPLIAA